MNAPMPPLGGHAPPLQCNRLLRWPDESSKCGRPATFHIVWTADLENGLACDEHMAEAKTKWCFFAVHLYRMECSMPGAIYLHEENVCVVDEDGLGLHEHIEEAVPV